MTGQDGAAGGENENRKDLQDERDFTVNKVLFQRHQKVMGRMIFHPEL